ncbi:MAG: hypothetical protein GX959_01120 [Clostridiales bacterium]|jgi:hypothetical protein|nr:hypothetical protein [Clostridiales bacterium]
MDKIKKLNEKFCKLPQPIIFLLVAIASAYASITAVYKGMDMLREFKLNDLIPVGNSYNVIFFIVSTMTSWLILELIIYVLYRYSRMGILVEGQHNTFKNTIRFFYIFVRIIVGSYDLTYFIGHEPTRIAFMVGSETVLLVAISSMYTLAYLVMKHDIIRSDRVFTVYYKLFTIYAFVQSISKGLNFILSLTAETRVPVEIVFSAVNLALVIAILLLLYFFVYKTAKKEQITYIANQQVSIFVAKDDDDIFKGYGL